VTIGILGGTFDPIHIGHLILAQEIGQKLCFSKILFIPAKIPPHKQNSAADFHRYEMVKLAIQDNPFFDISRVELDRSGISYTIDTIQILQTQLQEPLAFIIGADNILDLPNWYQWQKLVQICEFAIGSRPGFDLSTLDRLGTFIGQSKAEKFKQNCVEIPSIFISSSQIREKYSRGESVRYLVPDLVDSYICKNKLYLKSEAL